MKCSELFSKTGSIIKREPCRRIGLLGGTFNPVHKGHVDIAEKVFLEFSLSCVYFLVSGNPPHKMPEDVVQAKNRYDMVCLATSAHDFLLPSDIEIKREGKIYTVDTLRQLKARYPNDEFYYIIGSDTLFELESWKSSSMVFKMVKFICIKRQGAGRRSVEAEAKLLNEKYGAQIYMSEFSGPDISSTMIRNAIKRGESIDGLVDKKVEEYIAKNGLYK